MVNKDRFQLVLYRKNRLKFCYNCGKLLKNLLEYAVICLV